MVEMVLLQLGGAVLLLAGFLATQFGPVRDTSRSYLAVNTVGGADLAVVAWLDHDWGFLALEGTWAVASLVQLLRRRGRHGEVAAPRTDRGSRCD